MSSGAEGARIHLYRYNGSSIGHTGISFFFAPVTAVRVVGSRGCHRARMLRAQRVPFEFMGSALGSADPIRQCGWIDAPGAARPTDPSAWPQVE